MTLAYIIEYLEREGDSESILDKQFSV